MTKVNNGTASGIRATAPGASGTARPDAASRGGTAARAARPVRARPRTIPEQIADMVTSAILRGEYQAGDAVREQELADRFQVSRGPVREGLRILEKAGVVTIVPQRGARVTQLSAKEINNLFEIRCALVRLLPKHLLEADGPPLDEIDEHMAKLTATAALPDGNAYADAVYELNKLLADSCGNPQLGEIIRSLAQQTARYTRLGLRETVRRQASVKGWQRFAKALRRGDADAAGDTLVDLVDASRKAVLRSLSAGEASHG
jgi:DNA-binding GntR family transcriptional regulator